MKSEGNEPLSATSQQIKKNKKRKLRSYMTPETNLTREQNIDKLNNSQDNVMTSEQILIQKLRNQLEFYMGDPNLAKDRYLQSLLQKTTLVDITEFLEFNRIKMLMINKPDKIE